jgi:hypothetical protein
VEHEAAQVTRAETRHDIAADEGYGQPHVVKPSFFAVDSQPELIDEPDSGGGLGHCAF